jgi:hypothetical protein
MRMDESRITRKTAQLESKWKNKKGKKARNWLNNVRNECSTRRLTAGGGSEGSEGVEEI